MFKVEKEKIVKSDRVVKYLIGNDLNEYKIGNKEDLIEVKCYLDRNTGSLIYIPVQPLDLKYKIVEDNNIDII